MAFTRRNFLKALGIGGAAAVVAPVLPAAEPEAVIEVVPMPLIDTPTVTFNNAPFMATGMVMGTAMGMWNPEPRIVRWSTIDDSEHTLYINMTRDDL